MVKATTQEASRKMSNQPLSRATCGPNIRAGLIGLDREQAGAFQKLAGVVIELLLAVALRRYLRTFGGEESSGFGPSWSRRVLMASRRDVRRSSAPLNAAETGSIC